MLDRIEQINLLISNLICSPTRTSSCGDVLIIVKAEMLESQKPSKLIITTLGFINYLNLMVFGPTLPRRLS